MGLAAEAEPLRERLRQPRGAHARLHAGDIVRNAPELHYVVFQIGDRESRSGVAVAGLSDRSRVQQVTVAHIEAQSGERLRRTRTQIEHFQMIAGIRVGESALMVRMAEKCECGVGVQQPFQGLLGSEDVFVFILKRTVHQNNSADLQRTVRLLGEPFQIVGR